MWLLIRIALVIGIAGYRIFRRLWSINPETIHQWNSRDYGETLHLNRDKDIQSVTIQVPLNLGIAFTLMPERWFDRILAAVGLAHEFQTGDLRFDEAVYIGCDEKQLQRWLALKAPSRSAIHSLISNFNATKIYSTGGNLLVDFDIDYRADGQRIDVVMALTDSLQPLAEQRTSRTRPFFWRMLLCEVLVWSIAAYAIGGFLDGFFDNSDYLQKMPVVYFAMKIAAFGYLLTWLLLWLLLGRSSQARVVLVEAAIVMLLALPFASYIGSMEFNQSLTTATPEVVQASVVDKYRSSSRRSRHYTLVLHSAQTAYGLPVDIRHRVSAADYDHANVSDLYQLEVQPGRLGFAYVASYTRMN